MKRKNCEICGLDFLVRNYINHMRSAKHIQKSLENCEIDGIFKVIKAAFDCRLATFLLENENDNETEVLTPENFMIKHKKQIIDLLQKCIDQHDAIKVHLELFCEAEIASKNETEILKLGSGNKNLTRSTDINEFLDEIVEKLKVQSENFEIRNSGWTLLNVKHLLINVNKFCPLSGKSFVKLPKFLESKKAIINVKNNDNLCFLWSLLAFKELQINPKRKNSQRLVNKTNLKRLSVLFPNYNRFKFPMSLKHIDKFEKTYNISINVFGFNEVANEITGPLHCTKNEKMENHVNLLLIENDDGSHFTLIKDLSKLVMSQKTKKKKRAFICNCCLVFFSSIKKLKLHKSRGDCYKTITNMPTENLNIVQFKNYHKMMKIPIAIYADVECILEKIVDDPSGKTHKHRPAAAGFYILNSIDENLSKYKQFSGEKCMKKFISSLIDECKFLYNKFLKHKVPMKPLTEQQIEEFRKATICWICEKSFEPGNVKCRDHCHYEGSYRGAAHVNCNLKLKQVNFIPVLFHNYSNYDLHLTIHEISIRKDLARMSCIPINKNKYISLSSYIKNDENTSEIFEIRFLDSYRFMSESLDSLAKNLPKSDFRELYRVFGKSCDSEHVGLLTQKQVLCYEYLDNFEKLKETSLPPISEFYSSLTNSCISEKDYLHARNIWDRFKITNLEEYMLLYLQTDVLILADTFENFRKVCIEKYKLDPLHYFTTPGLSWDAMLRFTGVQIELITQYEMMRMVNSGVRGGITVNNAKYLNSNNVFLGEKLYDPCKKDSFLIYLDVNNLYGLSLSSPLPLSNFEWDSNEWTVEKILNLEKDDPIGYIFEVDLDYPQSLHDLHDDLPFCAESLSSPISSNQKIKKLILNLNAKKDYICHYLVLKQALQNGLVLKKVSRVLKFNQSPFMASYIEKNTEYRTQATNEFEKNFFKLLNNSIYGKTLESVDKRVDIKFVTKYDNKGSRKLNIETLTASNLYHSFTIIRGDDDKSEAGDFAIIQMKKESITFNRPIQIGFSVLELSKTIMYDFWYNYILKKYSHGRALLGYMDTDAFIIHVTTKNIFEDIKPDIDKYFDTSNFPVNNIHGIPLKNKKVLGKWKFETGEKIIQAFYGLRSKMYLVHVLGDDIIAKAKGVLRHLTKAYTPELYKDVLINKKTMRQEMIKIRSYNHQIYTEKQNKISLCWSDDKRFLMANNINTLAWGNYKIKQFTDKNEEEKGEEEEENTQ